MIFHSETAPIRKRKKKKQTKPQPPTNPPSPRRKQDKFSSRINANLKQTNKKVTKVTKAVTDNRISRKIPNNNN